MAKFFLVGAGPGRADLLTLRAARVLGQAHVVLYDRLVSAEVLDLVRPGAKLVYVGKEEGEQSEGQQRIYELFAAYGKGSRNVVRLKGGDPMVFGRGAEEWAWLVERGWNVELVPGISSSLAVPALAGVPVTFRGVASGFAVVTGHAETRWADYAQVPTLVILMGAGRRAEIARALIESGRPASEPACFVENGTTPRERIVMSELAQVAAGGVAVRAPAVFVVGEVVRVREALQPLLAQAIA